MLLGTTHKGTELAQWAKRLARVVGTLKQTNSKMSYQLQIKEVDRIQDSFDILLRSRGFRQAITNRSQAVRSRDGINVEWMSDP